MEWKKNYSMEKDHSLIVSQLFLACSCTFYSLNYPKKGNQLCRQFTQQYPLMLLISYQG